MFWQLGKDRTGKKTGECEAFEKSNLASISRRGSPFRAALMASDSSLIQANQDVAPPSAKVDAVSSATLHTNLSDAAASIVTSPWEQVPVEAIRALSTEDVESVRTHLKGSPSAFWAQAVTVLALRGTADDEALVKRPFSYRLPEGDGLNTDQRAEARDLLGAQLAVPVALGILAKSTGAEQPVESLSPLTRIEKAAEVIGPAAAVALRTEALIGLAVADTPTARLALDANLIAATSRAAVSRQRTNRYLDRLKSLKTPWMLQSNGAVAEVTDLEEQRIVNLRALIRLEGLDAALTKR
jgi:hypothetical protein